MHKSLSCLLFILTTSFCALIPLRAQPQLGTPPSAPTTIPPLNRVRSQQVTGGFSVDASSREAVRSFYNAIYQASEGVPIDSTANISNCVPGTNSTAFQNAVLCRLNWFRAMAGVPASITFDSTETTSAQAAALIMAANNTVQHENIPSTWHCFSTNGTNAAANCNLAWQSYGPQAITGYIWDFGAGNSAVGHRRWLLYPQTQVMASGDMPPQGSYYGANATWIFDSNYYGPRPTTRTPFVAWPPAGFAPYQVVFPQWSFALSNADFSSATVSMKSNGVNMAVSVQPYVSGFGENTLVWYPANLDPTSYTAQFPFNGTDTVYSITVSNVIIASVGFQNFSYSTTLFDPSIPGLGAVLTVVSGTNQPAVNGNNPYSCTTYADSNITGYQWLVSQPFNSFFSDGAEGFITNFTMKNISGYSAITNLTGETGNHCFYLAMPQNTSDQILQLNPIFLPTNNTTVTFKSQLGYATSNQIAEVQITTNNQTSWQNLYAQIGSGAANDPSFISHSISLSNYSGIPVQLRFNYHFNTNGNGSFYNQVQTNPPVGWFVDDITVTNCLVLDNFSTNSTTTTNFVFVPAQSTNYSLQARPVLFNQYGLAWGPVKLVSAVIGTASIVLAKPIILGNQVQLNFTNSGVASASFHLLQSDIIGKSWTTNTGAVLTTNVPGISYRFTTTNGSIARFYRIQSP